MPRDMQYTVYISWVKDGETKIKDISAFGEFSSDENDELEDLFGNGCSCILGHLTIDGELFLEATGRLPVCVLLDGSTTDIEDFEGYNSLVHQIDLRRIEQVCGKTLDLILVAIIEQDPCFASYCSMPLGQYLLY